MGGETRPQPELLAPEQRFDKALEDLQKACDRRLVRQAQQAPPQSDETPSVRALRAS